MQGLLPVKGRGDLHNAWSRFSTAGQWGYTLNGESPWYIDDFEAGGILRVTDNVVSQEERDITAIKSQYGEFDLYGM
jgi:hypothetical protein